MKYGPFLIVESIAQSRGLVSFRQKIVLLSQSIKFNGILTDQPIVCSRPRGERVPRDEPDDQVRPKGQCLVQDHQVLGGRGEWKAQIIGTDIFLLAHQAKLIHLSREGLFGGQADSPNCRVAQDEYTVLVPIRWQRYNVRGEHGVQIPYIQGRICRRSSAERETVAQQTQGGIDTDRAGIKIREIHAGFQSQA